MKMTIDQLKGLGYVETKPGIWYRCAEPSIKNLEPVTGKGILTPKPAKRIRQSSKPLLNKLEAEWYEVLKLRFRITAMQAIRFRLGNGIWYKPDFMAWPVGLESQDSRMRAFEVKGPHAFRGGMENLKVAANQYRQIVWVLVWKEQGQWKEQIVLP